jgi:steroid 5-alpha reductase family enzyme
MVLNVWVVGFCVAILFFQIVAIPAIFFKRNDLADVVWGPAFVISALTAVHWGTLEGVSSLDKRSGIMLILLTVWAMRLFIHIGWRNLSHETEDIRYKKWRESWGRNWLWRSYLQVFVLQPLILYFFLTPVLYTISAPQGPMSWVAFSGVAVWVVGFIFESIADEQLRRFKANAANKGKFMIRGLWSWSRHPNYFGEVMQWWGMWLIVLDLPFGWLTIISPIGVTFLILKVSGVTMLEDTLKTRSGYSEYSSKISKFIPIPPAIYVLLHKARRT